MDMEKVTCRFCNFKSAAAQKLGDNEINVMESHCGEVKYKSGDNIIRQDALATSIVYIKSGIVKIHVSGPIKEKILKIVKAPAYLCLPGTFSDKIHHFSATAIAETTVCFIDAAVFKQFIYNNGDFAFQIILDISKGEFQNFHNLINIAQKQNIGRVADAILFFAREIFNSSSFKLPISRQDLGDLLGITRESASRILSDFHSEKIIQINGRQITILKEELLNQISEKG